MNDELTNRRILVIDDNEHIHRDFAVVLGPEAQGAELDNLDQQMAALIGEAPASHHQLVYDLNFAKQGAEGIQLVRNAVAELNPYALVFVDMRMPPGIDGLETMRHIMEIDEEVQLVLCTAYSDHSWEQIQQTLGPSDRLLILKKPFEVIELRQLAQSLVTKWNIARRAEQELIHRIEMSERLRAEEERLRVSFSTMKEGLLICDDVGRILEANQQARHILALPTHLNSSVSAAGYLSSDEFNIILSIREALEQSRAVHFPMHYKINRDVGDSIVLDGAITPIQIQDKRQVLITFSDISRQLQLQEELHQSQKMDSIGQLAGGIAHDFNNMLAGIITSVDLLRARGDDPTERGRFLDIIEDAANRSADAVANLLAFARKSPIRLTRFDINESVRLAESLFSTALSPGLQMRMQLMPLPVFVAGDKGQMQNVVLNLFINARDAMEENGLIEVSTKVWREENGDQWVSLVIADDGPGIPENLRDKIFDPFFTTKEVGKGTGLGLSAVYGTIQEMGGEIRVEDNDSKGARFIIDLPLAEMMAYHESSGAHALPEPQALPQVAARVLLIDDEEFLRETAMLLLEELGMEVTAKESGEEGLRFYSEHGNGIDVVLIDEQMPGMSGTACAEKLQLLDPAVKIIRCTGYGPKSRLEDGQLFSAQLKKPYRLSDLHDVINSVLDLDKANS